MTNNATRSGKVLSGSIKELLEKAKVKQREKLNLSNKGTDVSVPSPNSSSQRRSSPNINGKPVESDSDSSSSGDENLVDPKNLDLRSSFFEPTTQVEKSARTPTPNFECNIGVSTLSDSEDEDGGDENGASEVVDVMKNLQNFSNQIDKAKETLRQYEARNKEPSSSNSADNVTDVSKLLAMGEVNTSATIGEGGKENGKPIKAKKRRQQTAADNSGEDSDWEEVQGNVQNRRKRLRV